MRLPWSEWPPRKKAKVLIAIFAVFVIGLLAWDNYDRYVYHTLQHELGLVESSFKLSDVVLIRNPPVARLVIAFDNLSHSYPIHEPGGYTLNLTFSMRNPSFLTVRFSGANLTVVFAPAVNTTLGFIVDNLSIPSMTLQPGEGFNLTFSVPLSRRAVYTIEVCDYELKYLYWSQGGASVQASYMHRNLTDRFLRLLPGGIILPRIRIRELAYDSLTPYDPLYPFETGYLLPLKYREVVFWGDPLVQRLWDAVWILDRYSSELRLVGCGISQDGCLDVGVEWSATDGELKTIEGRIKALLGEDLPVRVGRAKVVPILYRSAVCITPEID